MMTTLMHSKPYHNYILFAVDNGFYQLSEAERNEIKKGFHETVSDFQKDISIDFYVTLGMKAGTTFMLWCRSENSEKISDMLRDIFCSRIGKYLSITYTYFGMVRNSQYSGRTGKPEQSIENFEDRLPYLIVYPFTKTSEWHALDFETRKSIMGEHIKVGVGHPAIRQCLLYSYGVDDYEFVVSYETDKLEEFQDLVIQMRGTAGRKYTLVDTPTFTCFYKTPEEFLSWL